MCRQKLIYDGKLVTVHDGVEAVEPDEFRRLIFEPKDASAEELALWTVEHKKIVTKAWLRVQLYFYSVYTPCDSRTDQVDYIRRLSEDRLASPFNNLPVLTYTNWT